MLTGQCLQCWHTRVARATEAWRAVMDADFVSQLIDVAQRVVASGAISANGHGNVSLRAKGTARA